MLGGMAVFAFSNGENDIGAFPDYSFFRDISLLQFPNVVRTSAHSYGCLI